MAPAGAASIRAGCTWLCCSCSPWGWWARGFFSSSRTGAFIGAHPSGSGSFFQHPAARLGLGLALGGAVSNIYDQLSRGAVLDFLELGWWPVFNLADVAITLGVATASWFLY
jgi:lipoprotein signal peptidase